MFPSAFSKVLTSQTSWIVEPLKALLRRVRKVAIRSAMEAGKVEVLGNAARIMQALFPALLRDRAAWEDSKKPAALSLTVELFRLYFAINNLNLCKNLVRNVDSGQLPDPLKEDPSFPYQRGDAVSYAFYAGRLALLENKFQLADRLLSFAYRHSPRGHQNLKAILKYLIPVRLRRGLLPRNELLQRNGLSEFVPIAGAIRSGTIPLHYLVGVIFITRRQFAAVERVPGHPPGNFCAMGHLPAAGAAAAHCDAHAH